MIGRIVLQIIPTTIFFLIVLVLISSSSLASATAIPFDTIEKGQSPGELTGTFTKVFSNVENFAVFWSQHVNMKEQSDDDDDDKPTLPTVDFSSQIVAVVYVGIEEDNSQAYDVQVTSVEEDDYTNELIVNFVTSSPPTNSNTMKKHQMSTHPYHIIKVDTTEDEYLKVVFMGSARGVNKNNETAMPIFIVRKQEDNDSVKTNIEALPGVKSVDGCRSKYSLCSVYFDSDVINKGDAHASLEKVEDVIIISEDYDHV